MASSTTVPVHELNEVGYARREAQRISANVSADAGFAGKVSLIVTELARNLAIHAHGGQIIMRELGDDAAGGIEVLAIDGGRGMRNVADCFRDGFSTAGTPGTGLGAVRRLSDFFDVTTVEGRGTVICSRVFASRERRPANWEIGAINVAITGETVSGDSWAVREGRDNLRAMLADGLGHGHYAADAAREAVAAFRRNAERTPGEVLRFMDVALAKTRGAAAAVVDINPAKSLVTVAGAGNVAVRLYDEDGKSRQVASINGTVGTNLPKIAEFTAPWTRGTLVVIHSDGLTSQLDVKGYPGLLQRHPATIGGVLFRDFARGRDDATIVTVTHHR